MTLTIVKRREKLRVGVVGAGFVAKNFVDLARKKCDFIDIVKVYSRRPAEASPWIGEGVHTNSLNEIGDAADVVLEVSGDAVAATATCLEMAKRALPVVTLNCEFQVTNGSYFADKMFITEAHGDQPGNAAALHADALNMGFTPLAHINYKGFLNHTPTPEEMAYWSKKQGLRIDQVVSFTDGSKLQIEQAVTANGLGLDIACEGMIGGARENGFALEAYGDAAMALGRPIADFAQAKNAPPGIAIVAKHDMAEGMMDYIAYNKIATEGGKYLVLQTGYHLVHLEIPRILSYLLATPRSNWKPLLNNSTNPTIGAAAVAKRALRKGDVVKQGLGGFDVRASTVRISERPDHVPICLMQNAHIVRDVAPGDLLTFDDVELEMSVAIEIYEVLRNRFVGDKNRVNVAL